MSADVLLENFFSWFEPFVHYLYNLGISFDAVFFGLFIIIAAIWLGFALWGGQVAGRGNRSRLISFIIGLAIPVVYPMLLPGIVKRDRRKARALAKKTEAERLKKTIPPPETKRQRSGRTVEEEKRKERKSPVYSKRTGDTQVARASGENGETGQSGEDRARNHHRFFSKLARAQKEKDTPTRLHVTYGELEVTTEYILEVMPRLVVVETSGSQKPQSLRIPFKRINNIKQEDENGVWREVNLESTEESSPAGVETKPGPPQTEVDKDK